MYYNNLLYPLYYLLNKGYGLCAYLTITNIVYKYKLCVLEMKLNMGLLPITKYVIY